MQESVRYVDLPIFHRLRLGIDYFLVKGSGRYELTRQTHVGLPVRHLESERAICRLEDYPYSESPIPLYEGVVEW